MPRKNRLGYRSQPIRNATVPLSSDQSTIRPGKEELARHLAMQPPQRIVLLCDAVGENPGRAISHSVLSGKFKYSVFRWNEDGTQIGTELSSGPQSRRTCHCLGCRFTVPFNFAVRIPSILVPTSAVSRSKGTLLSPPSFLIANEIRHRLGQVGRQLANATQCFRMRSVVRQAYARSSGKWNHVRLIRKRVTWQLSRGTFRMRHITALRYVCNGLRATRARAVQTAVSLEEEAS